MDCGCFWIQEQVTIRMLATPALFQLSFLPGVLVFLPLKLPMVTPASAWFWGFSRVLFTDLAQAKRIYQSNCPSLVTLEEATRPVHAGPRTFSGLNVFLRGGYMSASQPHEGSILVADDNEANRELLSSLLGQEGYHIISVADGQQALEKLSSDSIDLLVLAVVMPRKTGFDVCLAIKSKPETRLIPVLMLTSLNGANDPIPPTISSPHDLLTNPAT